MTNWQYFPNFSHENTVWDNMHEMSNLVFWKNKEKCLNMSFAENFTQIAKRYVAVSTAEWRLSLGTFCNKVCNFDGIVREDSSFLTATREGISKAEAGKKSQVGIVRGRYCTSCVDWRVELHTRLSVERSWAWMCWYKEAICRYFNQNIFNRYNIFVKEWPSRAINMLTKLKIAD